jgi:hypothetical protein
MIEPELRVQIRRYFFAEHWKIGTIAKQLQVHPDTVRRAIEVERFQSAARLRASNLDPYLSFLRETLEAYPRLCATRLHRMIAERGYSFRCPSGHNLTTASSTIRSMPTIVPVVSKSRKANGRVRERVRSSAFCNLPPPPLFDSGGVKP